jgi:hypothetical protein
MAIDKSKLGAAVRQIRAARGRVVRCTARVRGRIPVEPSEEIQRAFEDVVRHFQACIARS